MHFSLHQIVRYYYRLLTNSLGNSESTHLNVACETAKIDISERIQGTHTEAVEFLRKIDEDKAVYDKEQKERRKQGGQGEQEEEDDQLETVFDSDEICNLNTDICVWINAIDVEAKECVSSSDDGDRDNISENKGFAKWFIQLCKMLPLFSAISNKFFDSPNPVGSSWSSETYFKNLRQLHGQDIPCSIDAFIKRDLQLSNASVIKASQKFFSIQSQNVSDDDATNEANCSNDESEAVVELDSNTPKNQNVENTPVSSTPVTSTPKARSTSVCNDRIECPACSNGDSPAGAHKCIVCHKAVHAIDGCSISIGEEEGYGKGRKCTACHQAESVGTRSDKKQVIDATELNRNELWTRSSRSKSSKYTKSKPNWDLIPMNKKVKIGCLVNESTKQTVYKKGRNKFKLSNTCAVDSPIQLIATAIAYNPAYRSSIKNENDGIFKITKALATKYGVYLHF